MMKIILAALFLSSCAGSVKYAQEHEKTFVTIKETQQNAKDSYNLALSFLAKSLNNSNNAIQIQDKDQNKIIANISLDCGFGTTLGVESRGLVRFNFDFQSKDKKIRIEMKAIDMRFAGISNELGVNEESIPFIKSCQDNFINSLVSSYSQDKNSNW